MSQPRREGLDGLKTGGIKKIDFYSVQEYNLALVQYHPLDMTHFAHKELATASIDLDHLALLSCRLGFFFSQLCASPWMVCGLIDFDFSDNHPHGLPSRFALDPLLLFRPWPNLCLFRCASTSPCPAGFGIDAHSAHNGLHLDPTRCATRPRHDTRLADKQPQPRTHVLKPQGFARFPAASVKKSLFPACRLCFEAATPPL
jgi:hypothetical protein